MKRVLFGLIVSHVTVAMHYDKRFDPNQQKLNRMELCRNSYLMSQMRFHKQNMYTRNHFAKQRDYTPKSKNA